MSDTLEIPQDWSNDLCSMLYAVQYCVKVRVKP